MAGAPRIAFKLLVGPALVMLVYVGLLRAAGNVVQITLFESAMGPMIGASIEAIQHGLNPASHHAPGGDWHYGILPVPAALVVCVAGCLSQRARVASATSAMRLPCPPLR